MPLLNKQVNYDILGTFIGASEGTDYINHIPELTRENIAEVGNAILDYQPAKEAFYNSFLTKITRQLFEGINGNNIFKFLKGPMTEGDIEDSYVDYIKGENFDGGTTNPFTQNKPDVEVLYHKVDRQLKYKTTVSDKQLRKAFLSDSGLSTLINKVVDSLTQSAEHDEYVMFKQLLVDSFLYEYDKDEDSYDTTSKYTILSGTSKSELVENYLYELKKHSMNMTFNTREYNGMGVLNKSSYDNQIIVMHKDYALDIDMGVLANTFNVDKMKLDGKVIVVDDFNNSTLTNEDTIGDIVGDGKIVGCIFDRRGVRFWDSLRTMETLRNPDALYTNYWLHIWQGLSYAYFHNMFFIIEPAELDEPDELDVE